MSSTLKFRAAHNPNLGVKFKLLVPILIPPFKTQETADIISQTGTLIVSPETCIGINSTKNGCTLLLQHNLPHPLRHDGWSTPYSIKFYWDHFGLSQSQQRRWHASNHTRRMRLRGTFPVSRKVLRDLKKPQQRQPIYLHIFRDWRET